MTPPAIPRDDRAVAPVVGVALLVAITVILAAAVGAVILATDVQEPPPDVDWTVSESLDNGEIEEIEFLHSGGDTIEGDQLRVVYTGEADENTDDIDPDRTYGAGDTFVVTFDTDGPDDAGESIRVVWSAADSDQTEIIHEHTLSSDVTS